jgi:hypothetical protein
MDARLAAQVRVLADNARLRESAAAIADLTPSERLAMVGELCRLGTHFLEQLPLGQRLRAEALGREPIPPETAALLRRLATLTP